MALQEHFLSSRSSKKQSTISFVWKKNSSWPVKKCHSEREARFSAVREMIYNVGLEKKDFKSEHKDLRSENKLPMKGMTDNRKSEKLCEKEFKVLKEEYFDKRRSKQNSEGPSPLWDQFQFPAMPCEI